MKKTTKIWCSISIVAVVAIAVILIVLQPWKPKQPEVIKIGVINSLTGSAAPYGENIQNGINLAVEEINSDGGIIGKKIELLVEDDGTDPKIAVTAFTKFINIEKIPVVIGPSSSSSAMACAPIANDTETVILSPGAATPNLTEAGDYVFRNRAPGQLEAIKIAEYAFYNLKLRNVAIFYINTDYGVGFKDIFKSNFEELGGKIIYLDSFDQGQDNFKTQISKMKPYNPDGVYVLGVPIEVGHFLKQSKELGFKTIFLMNNMNDPNLISIAGNAAEGIYFAIPMFDSFDANAQEFVANYTKAYGKTPDMLAANGYDAVYLIKYAIEHSSYDGESIKNALYQVKNYPGVSGSITFDQNGDVIKELNIMTVKNGEFVVIE